MTGVYGLALMGWESLAEKLIYLSVKEKMFGLGGTTRVLGTHKKPQKKFLRYFQPRQLLTILNLCV